MLVLSRKPKESIQIGEAITVTVLSIADGKIRLGFTAPDNVTILRSELLENKSHAKTQPPVPPEIPAR